MAKWLAPLAILSALAYVAWLSNHPAASQQPGGGEPGPRPAAGKQWLGAGSCSSVGCHNGNGLQTDRGSEYTTWILHDQHAHAYEVLFNARSASIVKNLNREDGKMAHELGLCLNCHVHEAYDKSNHNLRFTKEDGVSCESCHGAASSWISDHYKANVSYQEKVAMGMRDTRSMAGRVRSCTPCHVGSEGMEVDHDLIAAGHPRLTFEFSAYYAMMPHHWQDVTAEQAGKSPRDRPNWDYVAAWFVGRAATTQAALELLAARTRRPVWPEFAEHDCYACHQQLKDTGWRQEPGGRQRNGKALPWNDWYDSSLAFDINANKFDPKQILRDFKDVKLAMESGVIPDKKVVQEKAEQSAKSVGKWLDQFNGAGTASKDAYGILKQIVDRAAKSKARSWEEAAQTYLAVLAMYHASQEAKSHPQIPEALKAIRPLLQFPDDVDRPPLNYTPEAVRNRFEQLREKIGR